MTATLERLQRQYGRGQIRGWLAQHLALAQSARQRREDDRLGRKPLVAREAPWEEGAAFWSDMDRAFRSVPADVSQPALMALAFGKGGADLWPMIKNRVRERSADWREWVGEQWGITGGQVSEAIEETVSRMFWYLNPAERKDGPPVV